MVETMYMPVENADRYVVRKTQNTLGKDIIRYLAELVTNSDDSYNRLEENPKQDVDGRIYINILKNKKDKCYDVSVIDFAEGMSHDKLKEVFGTYGNDNAGGANGHVRGIFGQGASDVLRNACEDGKTAVIESIYDDQYTKMEYVSDKNHKFGIRIQDSIQANPLVRERLQIFGNGTKVTFGIPKRVTFNKQIIEGLKESIEKNPTFRYMLDRKYSSRRVYLGIQTTINRSELLDSSKYRIEGKVLYEGDTYFEYKKKIIGGHLTIYEKTKEEDEAKIIVRDENYTVYANSSFSLHNFQNMVGELEIKGLRKIVKNALNSETEPEEIFQDNRTGFDQGNEFYKNLDKDIYFKLHKLAEPTGDSIELTDNQDYKEGLADINDYLKNLSPEENLGGDEPSKEPPVEGIKFARQMAFPQKGKVYSLNLLINSKLIGTEDTITIDVEDNDCIKVTPLNIKYAESEKSETGLVIKHITIEANEITENPVKIVATCGNYEAKTQISVVPQNFYETDKGLEFKPNDVELVVDNQHKLKLYFDSKKVPIGSIIIIDYGGLEGKATYKIDENNLFNDSTYGVIDVDVAGGSEGEKYTVKASFSDIEAAVVVKIIKPSEQKNPTNGGIITGFEMKNQRKGTVQAYLDIHDGKIYINTNNPINLRILGDLRKLQNKNQKYTKEQNRYICDLIARIAAREAIKRSELKNGDYKFDGSESGESVISHVLDDLQRHKNELYKRLYRRILKDSIDFEE